MIEQLRANVAVLLKFYARNRLLLVIALLFLLLAGLTVASSLVFGTATGHFDIIAGAVSTLNEFAFVLSAGLGLFAISSHLRQRSLKMILTRPCLPENWVAAVFVSSLAVSAVLHGITIVFGLGLCLLWGVPVQSGLFFLVGESLVQSAIALAYLSFLTALMHPVLAVLLAFLFNESMFYGLRFLLLTGIKTTGGNPVLPFLEKATYAIYMLLPAFSPYSDRTSGVRASLRAGGSDWLVLLRTAGYAGAALGLFFLLTVWALRRRNLA